MYNKTNMEKKSKVLVTGAGGFIGHHLVRYLRNKGYWVRGVDVKYPEYENTAAHDFLKLDLRINQNTLRATEGIKYVFHLAANMGGIGYLEKVRSAVMHDNILIDANMLNAAKINNVNR